MRVATFGCLRGSSYFVAIDPGTDYHGQAKFLDGTLISVDYHPHLDPDPDRTGLHTGVVEKPVVYPHQTRNARAVALLAFSAGELAGQLESRFAVEPRDWKGTMDGAAFLRRVKRHAQRVGDWELIEQHLVHVDKDLWEHPLDAYALGQWCLGIVI